MQTDVYSKITGAGGGGCVLCLPRDPQFLYKEEDHKSLFDDLKSKGFTVYTDI